MNLDFENGFSKISQHNTFNHKDRKGLVLVFNVGVVLVAFVAFCATRKAVWGFVFLVLLLVNVVYYSRERNKIDALYAASYIVAGHVRTPEFLDLETFFPNYKKFEAGFENIQKECVQLVNSSLKQIPLTKDTYGGQTNKIGIDVKLDASGQESGWRVLHLKLGDQITTQCTQQLPSLAAILSTMPEVASCVISVLEPHTTIPIHIGYSKCVMRYMIAISVPRDRDRCFLWLNGLT